MVSVEYLENNIKPKDLALKILGNPVHKKGNALWYKSPLRAEERTASFEVSGRGFHDFGTGEHFNVISFVMRYNNCSFHEACRYLARLYGLTDNEYDNERVQKFLKEQRLAKERYIEKINRWFVDFMNFIERAWDENQECIKYLQGYSDSLSILYDRQVYLGCIREEILKADTFKDKERLKKQVMKERLPVWMRCQEGYSLISQN